LSRQSKKKREKTIRAKKNKVRVPGTYVPDIAGEDVSFKKKKLKV